MTSRVCEALSHSSLMLAWPPSWKYSMTISGREQAEKKIGPVLYSVAGWLVQASAGTPSAVLIRPTGTMLPLSQTLTPSSAVTKSL